MKFNCRSCGYSIEVTPPDRDHTVVFPNPCPNGDSISVNVQCEKCLKWTEIYWDEDHQLSG